MFSRSRSLLPRGPHLPAQRVTPRGRRLWVSPLVELCGLGNWQLFWRASVPDPVWLVHDAVRELPNLEDVPVQLAVGILVRVDALANSRSDFIRYGGECLHSGPMGRRGVPTEHKTVLTILIGGARPPSERSQASGLEKGASRQLRYCSISASSYRLFRSISRHSMRAMNLS